MIARRRVTAALCVVACVVLCACKGGGEFTDAPVDGGGVDQSGVPSYAEVAARYNERAAMLDRVWARCSAAFRFEDQDGKERSEQGEGHLQMVQPDRFALSVGKLGEILLWVGGDRERYWLIQRIDEKVAYVGRYSELTPEKASAIGLPVYPNEMMRLLGVVPMATDADAIVYRYRDGDIVVSILAGASEDGSEARWFYKLDATNFEPRAVRLKVGRRVILESALSDYIRVEKEGTALGPRIAKRSLLTYKPTGASMNIQIDDTVSDGKGKLRGSVFDFDGLADALGPLEIVDIDRVGDSEPGERDGA